MDRRTLLKRIALGAGAAYWHGGTLAMELAQAAGARDEGGISAPVAFPSAHAATLAALCEVIIPKTDTPGAKEAGVPAFVADMYAHWMNDAERKLVTDGLAALDAAARAQHGASYAECSPERQAALYGATREAAKGYQSRGFGARINDPAAPFFFKLRDLVTLGYFTSEAGITGELAYVPVPGRWEGDIDIKKWNRQIQI
ncbi:gluconate 2-dehydrogenase subunit 3 family protein [Duganella sp. FT80W]|uniref:Gluconate 2-dehydrogenase subunit 3 family protein n=1 Tax=Duganella guangzhouensis TaxID=2666084 RepID=A0A6I2KW99_9BURK|nr:gluconate 2-dehydrogenase subunit 3 family protein [Duganella guangzhouensis]MRW89810.1 gluconate 2-dehydrogenase subunit 3 family protein [Duganella guangzhouensis]